MLFAPTHIAKQEGQRKAPARRPRQSAKGARGGYPWMAASLLRLSRTRCGAQSPGRSSSTSRAFPQLPAAEAPWREAKSLLPLAGEGGAKRRMRARGRGCFNPSPGLAPLGHPLPRAGEGDAPPLQICRLSTLPFGRLLSATNGLRNRTMSLSRAPYLTLRRNQPPSDASEPGAASYAPARGTQILRIEIESQTSGEGRCNNGERGS
jgi:hypothetical protein